jgi:hypothetical protein
MWAIYALRLVENEKCIQSLVGKHKNRFGRQGVDGRNESCKDFVTDLIKALLGNSPVNTFQHTSRNNGGSRFLYVVTSTRIETVFPVWSVRSLNNEDLL